MNLVAVNELKSPRKLRERLEAEEELLLTNNGRPMALLLYINEDDNPEDLLKATREARSRVALTRIRNVARTSGADKMTPQEIDELVSGVRAERRAGR